MPDFPSLVYVSSPALSSLLKISMIPLNTLEIILGSLSALSAILATKLLTALVSSSSVSDEISIESVLPDK